MTTAMDIGNITELTNVLNTDQPCGTNPNGVTLVTGLALMHKNARLQDVMIKPFAIIILDYRRKHLLEMRGTDICNPIGHRIRRIVSHNKTSLYV
jgi:hypothetical protein